MSWRRLLLRSGLEEAAVAHPVGAVPRPVAARAVRPHADAFGLDAPLPGLAPHQADGALGVLEWAGGWNALLVAGPARAAVLEDDAGHTQRVEPRGHFLPFQVPGEVVVAAAGTDQDGR